jgi:nickel-dependent lactate racemase
VKSVGSVESAVQRIELAYGRQTLAVDIPTANLAAILRPARPDHPPAEPALLADALAHPIGAPPLRNFARPGQRVAIVTSDITRPCPSARLLPLILAELSAAGVRDPDITVVAALGLHRPMTGPELAQMAGPAVYERVHVVNHDPADVVPLGATSRGTPVAIFRPVVEADLRICLGNLELHYFVGYSGGAKAIVPGCAARETVAANHAHMTHPDARAARLESNPVRLDLEEAAGLVGVDWILNVLVDGDHRVVGAVAGDVTAAHRHGCRLVAGRNVVKLEERADVVLVSAGGHPKDLNLYQAQKALDNAAQAVRDGGAIILLAECGEGLGNATFQEWMVDARPDEILARIRREFVLGGHKAAAIASVLRRAAVYLVSALDPGLVQRCSMVPFERVGEALASALAAHGPGARVLVMPEGGAVLPVVGETR